MPDDENDVCHTEAGEQHGEHVPHAPVRQGALIKKKIKFSSYIRKFRVEQLQSPI
jgi:hypothetical protein